MGALLAGKDKRCMDVDHKHKSLHGTYVYSLCVQNYGIQLVQLIYRNFGVWNWGDLHISYLLPIVWILYIYIIGAVLLISTTFYYTLKRSISFLMLLKSLSG